MITFNTDNMVAQEFPFPAPIMDYIFKNLTASQLLKLYKTCKFFYAKFRLNIIEDFDICGKNDEERMIRNSLAISHQNPAWSKLNNLWISKSFSYCENFESEQPLELNFTKFSRMTYTSLFMDGKLSVADYEFLIKPVTLRHLYVNGAIDCPNTELHLSVEEILKRAPHVSTVDISLDDDTVIDMTKLIALNCQTKITSLHLHNLLEIPDPLVVVEFFKKHAAPGIDYYFGFSDNVAQNAEQFYKTIDDGLREWKLSLEMPPTISSSFFVDLTGKIALITGASEGIGRATVILFRQLGASVIAVARNIGQLKILADECQDIKNDGFLLTFSADTFDPYYDEALVSIIDKRFGSKLDILVVNIDISGYYSIPNFPEDEINCEKYIVLESHYNIVEAATSHLKNAKGCVINVSNTDGVTTKPKNAASVADLERKIKMAELGLASSGVRTNTINPCNTVTALPQPDGMNDLDYKKLLQKSNKTYDEQAANSIAFLASDAAKIIDGAVLPVNALNLC